MAKTISNLNVILGATAAPFNAAIGGAESTVQNFTASLGRVGSAIAGLTGAGLALGAIKGIFDKVFAAPGEAIAAATRQADAETRLGAVLKATAGAAGFSANALKEHAAALQKTTTFGDEAILEFQAVLATFRNVSGPVFEEATGLALDMASVMGTDLQSAGVQLGKALNDPTEGISALTRVGVSFTEQQKQQIKAMQEAGNMAGAQAVIIAELKGEFGGAAEAMAKTPFGRIKQLGNVIGDLGEQVGDVLAVVTIGFTDAFNVDGALSALSGGLSHAKQIVETGMNAVVPVVKNAVNMAVGVFDGVYGYVAPIVMQIYDFASSTLGGVGGVIAASFGAASAVFGAVAVVIGGPLVLAAVSALSAFWAMSTAAVAFFAPVIAGAGLAAAAVGAIGAAIGLDNIKSIFSAVGSIVSNAVGYIVGSWNTVYTAGVTIWEGVAAVFSAAMGVIETVASAVWSGVVATFNWALGLVGLSTATIGNTVNSAWGKIVDGTKWLVGVIETGLFGAAFIINHLGDAFGLLADEGTLAVVKLGNQIAYVFTDVIPGLLTWFENNWLYVFKDVFNFTTTVFGNIAANIYEVFSNLPGLISGTTDFKDIWTPLTAGFESTITQLPDIADRQAGPLEKALQSQADAAKKAFGQDMGAYIGEHMNKAASDALGKTAALKPILEIDKPKALDTTPITKPLGAVSAAADKAKGSLDAVLSGSAESMRAMYVSPQVTAAAAAANALPAAAAAPVSQANVDATNKAAASAGAGGDPAALITKAIDLLNVANAQRQLLLNIAQKAPTKSPQPVNI